MDFLTLRRREFETTLRVLQAYPADQAQLRPAAKSRTALELATTLANEERVIGTLLESGVIQPGASRVEASSMAASISAWQDAAAKNDASITRLSPADWQRGVDFYGLAKTLGEALWLELLDHIHHRGQFSIYLRMAGAKVPSIYGPTADFEWSGQA
jgi:uncharacterized damage-inducible protein DinB